MIKKNLMFNKMKLVNQKYDHIRCRFELQLMIILLSVDCFLDILFLKRLSATREYLAIFI